ncbi:TetR family transcriptional regulator [Streptomyces globisporus]|uniref:TetR family transcriptional regulator n=1 Tax=Streptomyces globisporus TaxID=1908 RepID=UPI0036FC6A55
MRRITPCHPRTKPAEERRADLMDAAEGVFAERGTDAARIDEITERAGVVSGTFHLHFSSQHDIMLAVEARFVDRLVEAAAHGSAEPARRRVALSGDDVTTLSQREVARRAALVAQDSTPDFDFTVEEVAAMGRGPWLRAFASTTGGGDAVITAALERVRLTDGPPAEVLDPELVRTVFGVTCTHLTHPVTGGLLLAFSPRRGITPG